jgi:hypothetical protein
VGYQCGQFTACGCNLVLCARLSGPDGGIGTGGSTGTGGTTGTGGAGGSTGKTCGGRMPSPCAANEICDATAGFCDVADMTGTCVVQPQGCTADWNPVCGCNGTTYSNDCERQVAGVSKNFDGACPSVDAGADIGLDGQAIDGRDGTSASGESRSNPCASCAADQVCIQLNDGICSATTGLRTACRTVSDACRTKLANSGSKSCSSLSECESELCPQPNYECVYANPCGNEIPEAAVYCYGI